ncbi:MAG: CARDB domain-containing protein [Candidatus Pacearchaeota archaeon]
MKFLDTLSYMLIFILLGVIGFIIYQIYPIIDSYYFSEVEKFVPVNDEGNRSIVNITIPDDFPDGVLFYDNMRFKDKRISYFIDQTCSSDRADDARRAFDLLEENTILEFYELDLNGQIEVSCSNSKRTERRINEGYFIAGEGGPSSIINATNFYIINNGTIFLYKENTCSKPIIAIHEILHVLGFKHSIDKNSIMYNTVNCNQQMTKEIIDNINELYSIPSLPDLIIIKAVAEKKGIEFSFNIEIINAGLKKSEPVNLTFYGDNNLIGNYNIGELDSGTGKEISVSGIRVNKNLKDVSFIIDADDLVGEINEGNNRFDLSINEN